MMRELDYDWIESSEAGPERRFPDWALGFAIWAENWSYLHSPAMLERFQKDIETIRQEARPGGALPHGVTRVFISHKQENRKEALRVAWLANQAGHHFWLDILDPQLQQPSLNPIQIACIIEIALLNCTHVIALISPESRTSRWIPYEYGRVKEPTPWALKAACWLHLDERTNFPEYLHLGTKTGSESDILSWLAGTGAGRKPAPWSGPEPLPKLPS